jgi:hypothetical protein
MVFRVIDFLSLKGVSVDRFSVLNMVQREKERLCSQKPTILEKKPERHLGHTHPANIAPRRATQIVCYPVIQDHLSQEEAEQRTEARKSND